MHKDSIRKPMVLQKSCLNLGLQWPPDPHKTYSVDIPRFQELRIKIQDFIYTEATKPVETPRFYEIKRDIGHIKISNPVLPDEVDFSI